MRGRSANILILLPWLALSACSGNSQRPPEDTGAGPTPLTGGEHLGWNQAVSGSQEISSLHWAIYVDGARSELVGASCLPDTDSVFACDAPIPTLAPGTHALQITAFRTTSDGTILESERTAPLQVMVSASRTTLTSPRRTAPRRSVLESSATDANLSASLVATSLEAPTDLAFAPDGRIFITERAGRVRVIRDGHLLSSPALTLAPTEGRSTLLGLALDPAFQRTPFVYLLYTEPSRSGGTALTVARFRELSDTLAERVILLDEIPTVAERPSASLRFGPDEKLYVASDDAGNARLADDLGSFSGKILRLNADGSTPGDQAGGSPVYSAGFQAPLGFDWQPGTSILWIADGHPESTDQLRAVVGSSDRFKRGEIRTTYALPPHAGPSALAFYRGKLIPEFQNNLLIAANDGRYLLRIRFDEREPARIVSADRLLEDQIGGLRALGVAPDGSIYVCTVDSLLRLLPFP